MTANAATHMRTSEFVEVQRGTPLVYVTTAPCSVFMKYSAGNFPTLQCWITIGKGHSLYKRPKKNAEHVEIVRNPC